MTKTNNENIKRNLEIIRKKIENARKKSCIAEQEITIVAVTKTATVEDVQMAYDLGIRHFGENRIEFAIEKMKNSPEDTQWHMIGTIQRRKIPLILQNCKFIDSVDRVEVAETIQKRAGEVNTEKIPILVQLNISGEKTKHGFSHTEFEKIYEKIQIFDKLYIRGLMTIAPINASEKTLRQIFSTLRNIAEKYKLKTLSMGMSDDYEIAIEEGATEIRLGRAIFGSISYNK
ncbi:MAG: YggS family pyridoxal phosphate-dependent enzyme [Candidatus Hydrogenedens sp.]